MRKAAYMGVLRESHPLKRKRAAFVDGGGRTPPRGTPPCVALRRPGLEQPRSGSPEDNPLGRDRRLSRLLRAVLVPFFPTFIISPPMTM